MIYQVMVYGTIVDLQCGNLPSNFPGGAWMFYLGPRKDAAEEALDLALKQGFWPSWQEVDAPIETAQIEFDKWRDSDRKSTPVGKALRHQCVWDTVCPHPAFVAC